MSSRAKRRDLRSPSNRTMFILRGHESGHDFSRADGALALYSVIPSGAKRSRGICGLPRSAQHFVFRTTRVRARLQSCHIRTHSYFVIPSGARSAAGAEGSAVHREAHNISRSGTRRILTHGVATLSRTPDTVKLSSVQPFHLPGWRNRQTQRT